MNKSEAVKNILQKNDCVEIEIEDIGSEGEGIGRYQGYTLFVKDAVVGDFVRVKIMKPKKTYGYAKLEQILRPSQFRVQPRCEIAGKCGGCQLQQISYSEQLIYKQNKVKNCMERIGGIHEYEMLPIIGMEEPYYYRNKAQYPVGISKDGNIITGFYAGHTHVVIDTKQCFIGDRCNEVILHCIKKFLNEYKISVYDEKTHAGLVRNILIRSGFKSREVLVCIVINGEQLPHQQELVKRLLALNETTDDFSIRSICLNINKKVTNVILGEKIQVLYQQSFITDYIGEVAYRISPLSFYQVNPIQTEKLYKTTLDFAQLTGNEIVWDLYCGIGTISLFLAQRAKQVYGVEIVPQAIEDAKQNALLNHITNAEFFVGAAEDILPEKYKESGNAMRADVIVVDPPRKGCEQGLLRTVVAMQPKRIVYVSCDPATLARDCKFLQENEYKVDKVQPVDQFPHTTHVETVVLLQRKDI